MELVFATNNPHKLLEIASLLDDRYTLISLKDLGFSEDIPEDHETLEENASQKARVIYDRFGKNCFADDTGLEVEALGGAPGVYSARYSRMGELQFPEMEAAEGNIRKLLQQMERADHRKARFRTVISLILDGKEYRFEGIVDGQIAREKKGTEGFGYDPVFVPDGHDRSFAQMDLDLKNSMSHRGRALAKLVEFLKQG